MLLNVDVKKCFCFSNLMSRMLLLLNVDVKTCFCFSMSRLLLLLNVDVDVKNASASQCRSHRVRLWS
eukprot:6073589-Karenia_brevis.AAC.1